jgi:flagellar export protein FliJ
MRSAESKSLQGMNKLAKFRFALETLLRYRQNIEDKERDAMLRLWFEYQTEIRNRADLNVKRHQTMSQIVRMQTENQDQKELAWFYLYLNRLTLEINECEKSLLKLESEIQIQKEVLLEASKKRKTLSSMKARQKKDFIRDLERQEQREVDELVVSRFVVREPGY